MRLLLMLLHRHSTYVESVTQQPPVIVVVAVLVVSVTGALALGLGFALFGVLLLISRTYHIGVSYQRVVRVGLKTTYAGSQAWNWEP